MSQENRKYQASLSTMWAIRNYPTLNDFASVASNLGFRQIELNHQVTSRMLNGFNLDHLTLSSIHEPCPADISTKVLVERDWLISSTDEISRQQGVESIKHSINLAHELNAPVVVVHCGNVSNDTSYEGHLRSIYNQGGKQSNNFKEAQSQLIKFRADLAAPRINAVTKSLGELIEYASQFNIKLGLENRYHYLDIPSIDEMEILLNLSSTEQLGFLYDVGHAQAMDQLGFYAHSDWLDRFSHRIFGTHLHDVAGITDHLAPGLGDINFADIAHYIPTDAIRTLELTPGNTLAQVKDGLDLLVRSGCIHI